MSGAWVEGTGGNTSVGAEGHADLFPSGAGAVAPGVGLSISTNLTAREGQGFERATDGKSFRLIGFLGASYMGVKALRLSKQMQVGGGVRKPCTGFSKGSRRSMQKLVSQFKTSAVCAGLFITLTYPSRFPDGTKAKRDLFTFLKRLKRAYPGAAGLWKLEPQKRGAPHFHLIVLGVPFIEHTWVATAWFEIVGSRDVRHWQAGTEVRRVKSHQHAVHYVSKYIAKPTESYEDGDGLGEVGSRWGKFGDWREHLGEVVSLALNASESAKLARVLDHKRLAGARLIKRPQARKRAIVKARRRRPLKLSQYWLGSPDVVLANLLKIIGRQSRANENYDC
jgi:hypothetical protein